MSETTPQPKAIRRADYRPPDYRIETVDLEFDLEPQTDAGQGAAGAPRHV